MKRILFLMLSMALLVSCASSLPQQFTKLADRVEKNGASFSAEQWDKASAEFDKLMEKYNQDADKYNAEQKKEINSAVGRFQAAVFKAGVKDVGNAVEELVDGAKGFIEGLGGE